MKQISLFIFVAFLGIIACQENLSTTTSMSMSSTSSMSTTTMANRTSTMSMGQNQTTMTTMTQPSTTTAPKFGDVNDTCIEKAKQTVMGNLNSTNPQIQNLTSMITSPREFYRNLFNQSFNQTTFDTFCDTYTTGRKEFDKCPNSTAKTMVFLQVSVVDYVCMKRRADFASNIDCLQKISNKPENVQCRSSCASNEQASMSAHNAISSTSKAQLSEWAGGDCDYMKCMADCRKTIIEKECGANQNELELEALKVAFQAARAVTDSLDMMNKTISDALQNVYPQRCRDFETKIQLRLVNLTANDYLAEAMKSNLTVLLAPSNSKNDRSGGSTVKFSGFLMVILAIMTKLLF